MRKLVIGAILSGTIFIVGCGGGGGGTTTVVKPTTIEKTTTVTAPPRKPRHKPAASPAPEPTPEPAPEPVSEEPPNVVGLSLPAAEEVLSEAGFKAAPRNTDTAFGIVVPSHYTICKEGKPIAGRVPVLAQKYGC
ncbi:MAG TPA: PASTA domain-containing protein [Solirubrobacterales bacterium]|jgi:hypothetical protein|nr:PASTA domain-containing protein [Solirubrobacterales bacterium]